MTLLPRGGVPNVPRRARHWGGVKPEHRCGAILAMLASCAAPQGLPTQAPTTAVPAKVTPPETVPPSPPWLSQVDEDARSMGCER